MLCFHNGLVAGPEEVFFANCPDQAAALHHVAGVIVDLRKHQCATLTADKHQQHRRHRASSRKPAVIMD